MEFEKLQKDMIQAMKAKDKPRKEAISSLIAAIKKVAIDEGCRDEIKEELVDRVILKELKTAKEQLDTCPKERTDLLEGYQIRHDVIKEYAPAQLSLEKGKADGNVINQAVTELCRYKLHNCRFCDMMVKI